MDCLGFNIPRLGRQEGEAIEQVVAQRPLQKVLRFLGCSIHDVCNDPITRDKVRAFYKLHHRVQRSMEVTELERWWAGVR